MTLFGLEITLDLILYTGAFGLIVIGAAGIVLAHHLFRVILALAIAEAGANLLLVLSGYRWDAIAPILSGSESAAPMVDPVPQAMVLTAIVIGVGVQALAVGLAMQVKKTYGTLDMSAIRQRLEADIAGTAGIATTGSQDAPLGERPLPPADAVPVTPGSSAR
ncbi:MAG: NADH-quinone oxidoreductase subunit K [Gammaproteobacteria bacterium]|nr:NADH-quinone oxidoreductase subunit K [Gammaproteobacteria bacterium]MBU2478749.1 NADH-quinone oxidoreductase subunit K [Gammaproteobacteria bacterium]